MQTPLFAGSHARGFAYGLLGVLLLSPDTLIIRLVDADPWVFIAWRGLLMAIGVFVILGCRYGTDLWRRTRLIGWTGLLVAVFFGINNVFFQLSVQSTLVANTLIIIATAPLFAACFSVLFLNESVPLKTWIATAGALVGVIIVVSGSLGPGDLFGNIAALMTAVGLGAHFVLVRLRRSIDMAPAVGIGAIMTSMAGLVVASDLYLAPEQFGYITLLGLILLPLSFVFLTRAPRLVPAPEVSLILLLETILGPLWVWLFIREEPPLSTLIGGALIIVVLTVHACASLGSGVPATPDRTDRRPVPRPAT